MSDAGLANLKALGRLRRLDLTNTAVTDAGLVHLHNLPQLRELHLKGTKVSAAGAKSLTAALPALKIIGINPK